MALLPDSPRERRLLIVFAVVVVLAGGFLVLRGSGGGSGDAAPDIATGLAPGSVPDTDVTPSPEPSASPTLIFDGRDPFIPLIEPGSGTTPVPSPTDPVTAPSPTTSPSAPPAPSPSPSPTPSPTPTPTSTGGGDDAQIEEHYVRLVDIFQVDGADWVRIWLQNEGDDGAYIEAREGQMFEYVFKVVSVDAPCTSFLHGETPFTLCLEE